MAHATPQKMAVPTLEELEAKKSAIMRMVMVGGVFVAVGYLLIIGALVLEFTQFHPLIQEFFTTQTAHSIAGGGADRAGDAALNQQLASIHQFPSTLLWMKLGGIGHILTGVFISLAAIVRALAMMPQRLGLLLQGGNAQAAESADD